MFLCRESDTVLWHFNTLVQWKIHDFIKTQWENILLKDFEARMGMVLLPWGSTGPCVSQPSFGGHQLITQIKTEQIPKECFSHFLTQGSPEGALVASWYLQTFVMPQRRYQTS